jgi:hypothetical protein
VDDPQADVPTRIEAIDTARGGAMLFVFVAHFAQAYFEPLGDTRRAAILEHIGMVASPTFMLLSGMMLGWLGRVRAQRFAELRGRLIDRGLFLLLVAHPLILIGELPRTAGWHNLLHISVITDVLGIAMLLGPALVTRIGPWGRLGLAVAVYAVCWPLVLGWQPAGHAMLLLKATLVGATEAEPHIWTYNVPMLPFLAIYAAGTSIGHALAASTRPGHSVRTAGRLAAAAVMLVAGGVATRALVIGLRSPGAPADPLSTIELLTSPWQKLPPSPVYVAIFGGAGLLLSALVMWWVASARLVVLTRPLQLLGRASLFVFIAQYYVYYVALQWLRLPMSPLWPLLFVASVVVMWMLASRWDAARGNQWLSVGLGTGVRAAPSSGLAPTLRWCSVVLLALACIGSVAHLVLGEDAPGKLIHHPAAQHAAPTAAAAAAAAHG